MGVCDRAATGYARIPRLPLSLFLPEAQPTMPSRLSSTALFAGLFCSTSLLAQSIVVPNANAATLGTSQLNSIIRNAGNPRSYQYGINASELAGVPLGSVITGVSLRFMVFTSNSASWPPADIVWNNYDIFVGPAIPTATWSGNASTNFAAAPQQCRSGPMTLDAGVFSNLGIPATPNPWAEFYFDFQVPYQYLGGDLAMLFSHPGSTDPAVALYPECVVSNAAAHGVGRSQSVYPAGIASAATTFYVMRIHYGYGAGCPGTSGTAPVMVQNGNTTGGAGGTIRLSIGNAPASTVGLFVIGFASTSSPMPNGCTLLASPDVTLFGFFNPKGRAVLSIAVPPGLTVNLFAQGAVLDPGAPGGFTMTNGVSPSAL